MSKKYCLILSFVFLLICFSLSSFSKTIEFSKETINLKPGISKHLIRTENERGEVVLNVLEVDLLNKNISIKVGMLNEKKIKAKAKLSEIVKKEKAYAGINANYFDVKVGNPLGTLITDGKWLVGPVYDRAAIGFTKDRKILIDRVMLTGFAKASRGFRRKPIAMFEIDGLNIPPHLYKQIGLFTNNFDEEFIIPENKTVIFVKDGRVRDINDPSIKIPDDGYVIVGNNNGLLNSLKKKDRLKINWQSSPDWSDVTEAVSGGPYLIMNSEVYVDEAEQKFKFAKKDAFAARSAIGIGNNGNLFLITVNGRRDKKSGLTLKEFAAFLNKLELKEAINLDGGGSTTLVVDGKTINELSERHERKISNGLLIFYNP